MTALLEYLNLDCSIIISQIIIDAIELSSPSQLQIILGGKTPIIFFTQDTAPPCP